jgi:hypothetical protein
MYIVPPVVAATIRRPLPSRRSILFQVRLGTRTRGNQVRRAGRSTNLGVEFDVYWLSPDEMQRPVVDAGFTPVFWGGRPAEGQEGSPQGYLVARRS